MTIGLRISKIDPDPEPQRKVITEDKIQVTVDWAKKNGKTLDDIAAMYDFESEAVRDAVADALIDNDLPE